MPESINSIKWAKAHFAHYNPKYKKYEQYYYGEQPIRVSDKIKKAFTALLGDTRDNLCPLVCDTLSDRLTLEGFSSSDEAVNQWLTEIWDTLRMELRSADTHAAATRMGDSYVMVWPDENNPREPKIYIQDSHNIAVRYEDNGLEQVCVEAIKCWESSLNGKEITRVNRYTPETIERYFYEQDSFGMPDSTDKLTPYMEGGQTTNVYDNPMGFVSYFRFANSLNTKRFAHSELTDVMPHQDIINKVLADMVVGEEFHALPQRWAVGLTTQVDPETGAEIEPFESDANRLWYTGDPETKFGQFNAADLEQFLKVLNDERLEIARVSRTPLHCMLMQSGDFPSGEALRTAEAPLVSKAKKRQSVYGEIWTQVILACAQIAGINATAKIEPIWQNAASITDSEKLSLVGQKLSIGVSKQQALREAGYDDKDIERMMQENDEASVKLAQSAAATFNAGRGL